MYAIYYLIIILYVFPLSFYIQCAHFPEYLYRVLTLCVILADAKIKAIYFDIRKCVRIQSN